MSLDFYTLLGIYVGLGCILIPFLSFYFGSSRTIPPEGMGNYIPERGYLDEKCYDKPEPVRDNRRLELSQ